ncbi:MAG: zinc-dependent alcohol dehydrogenase family protein [Chlamydiae bacterium]|nr:zinc-dependent alcohol dehydrogenase family protein [Chlamydiota bacterium]
MRAMVLQRVREPLCLQEVLLPDVGDLDLLVRVKTCGVCRTDLHIVEGELPCPKLPLILGHQVVGVVEKTGALVTKFSLGQRVGIPWLGGCCMQCEFCLSGRENLCERAVLTGYLRNGGYAEYCAVGESFALPLPTTYDDVQVAPLLCSGAIGYRALKKVEAGKNIGFYGFGSSAHILLQIAKFLGKEIFVFTRETSMGSKHLAHKLGAAWVGNVEEKPPVLLDAALIFAPVGALYPQALRVVKKGGSVISVGIHMSDIPSFPYALLWGERILSSVANLTMQDGREMLEIADKTPLHLTTTVFPLEEANQALAYIKEGKVRGSIVLQL